jgi:hypothetical protein
MSIVTILAGVIGLLLIVGAAVFKKLITDEMAAYVPVLSARLVRSAASKLPEEWRERYEQEWRGEVASYRDRRISGFIYALRVRLSVHSLVSALDVRTPDLLSPVDTGARSVMPSDVAARIIQGLLERTALPGSPWHDIQNDLADNDFDVTDELQRIDRNYAEGLNRARQPIANRPGMLSRMREYERLWSAARSWRVRR